MIVRNAAYSVLNSLVTLVSAVLVTSVFAARVLGPDAFGSYSYALSIVTLAVAVASLGIDPIALKYASRDRERADACYRFAFLLKAAAGALLGLAIVALSLLRRDIGSVQREMLLLVSLVPAASAWSTYQARLLAEQKAREVALRQAAAAAVGILARVAILVLGLPVVLFAACVLLDRIAIGILLERLDAGLHGRPRSAWEFRSLPRRDLLRQSWPLFVSGAFNVVYLRIDQLMLFEMRPLRDLADYSIAVKWSEAWYFIPLAVISSLTGRLYGTVDPAERERRFALTFHAVGTIAVLFCLFFFLLGGTVVDLLYGGEFAGAAAPLRILAFSGIVATLGTVWSSLAVAVGRQKVLPVVIGASTAANIVLNALWIPVHGAVGAAWATVLANVAPIVVAGLLVRDLRPGLRMMAEAATAVPGAREAYRLWREGRAHR